MGKCRPRSANRPPPEKNPNQEFIAIMLGVSRPTVTLVASTLQKARGRFKGVKRPPSSLLNEP